MFVFLICTERSGSNFLTNLAGGLPSVSAPPPTHLFRLFANNRANYGDLENDANWSSLVADVVDNFQAKLGTWHSSIDADELIAGAKHRDVFELLRMIYEKEAAADRAMVSFVKENHTHTFATTLLDAYPDARFVMMVRDPRDVAASWVLTDSIAGGVQRAVDVWLKDQSEAEPVYGALHQRGRAARLRYEDLIAAPRRHLEALADFMGVPFDESVFEFYRKPRTRANAERIEAWANIKRPIMHTNAGKYRNTLSATDIRYVELRCGELMQRFGYAPETDAANRADVPTEIERLLPHVSPGRFVVEDDRERAIRDRRRAALNRVLARRPS